MNASKALYGIRVLDLSRQFPGPYATMILADFGADVLRIEDRRFANDLSAWPVMRNKRHMTLNIKSPRGKEIFLKLLEGADVVVEGFRPGATSRMGIGYDDLKAVKPDIIYASLSGYGQTGPYSGMAGHDLNYIGVAGILALNGEPGRKPVIPPVQIADIGGGLNAAVGILVALFHRQRTGEGQYVDVSLTDAAVGFMTLPLMQYAEGGVSPQRGKMPLVGMFPFYRVYETKDGDYITIGAVEPRFWKKLCETLGCEDLEGEMFCSGEKAEQVEARLEEIFRRRTRDEWFGALREIDVCVGRVLSVGEMIGDPQVRHRGMIVEVEVGEGRTRPVQGIVAKLSETPGRIVSPPAGFGQHTVKVLKELGYSEGEIEELFEQGVC